MIVRQFLLWARSAPASQRAEAVRALARTFLGTSLSPSDRAEAETALIAMLDDPSPLVRKALAETFGAASGAPAHIVLALANDQSDIAALVLSRSPLLTDADLVDCAALGDDLVQRAIAMRPGVSVGIAAALAEIADAQTLIVLVENRGAQIVESSLSRILERHGADAALREALLARPGLPATVRQSIAVVVSTTLSSFAVSCGWLTQERGERVTREAREKTTVVLSAAADDRSVARLVRHLRTSRQLTPALILRALLSRNLPLVEAAFAELADYPADRVAGILREGRMGFQALFKRTGLPESVKGAFVAALSVLRAAEADGSRSGAQLSRRMIERVLAACSAMPDAETGKLLALLRRFQAEAVREEARDGADRLVAKACDEAAMRRAPGLLIDNAGLDRLKAA